jgi:hypothetical protein
MLSTRQGIGILMASLTALAAAPTPAARQAFLKTPMMVTVMETKAETGDIVTFKMTLSSKPPANASLAGR